MFEVASNSISSPCIIEIIVLNTTHHQGKKSYNVQQWHPGPSMDFLYNNPEYRPENACKCAYIRKAFYENKISFDEALAEAKEDEKGGKI